MGRFRRYAAEALKLVHRDEPKHDSQDVKKLIETFDRAHRHDTSWLNLEQLILLQNEHVNIFPAITPLLLFPEHPVLYEILTDVRIELSFLTLSQQREIAHVMLSTAREHLQARYQRSDVPNDFDVIECAALRVLKRLGEAGKWALSEYYRLIEELETFGASTALFA